MPNLYELNRAFRARLIALDDAALRAIRDSYGTAYQAIDARLRETLRQIEEAQAAGETVNASWLNRQERLESLLRDVRAEIERFSGQATGTVTANQAAAVSLGLEAAPALLAAATGDAAQAVIGIAFNRVPTAAFQQLVGFTSDGTPLRKLLDELGPSASTKVRDTLKRGVAQGYGAKKIAREVKEELGGDMVRAMRISRTETLRAYRAANIESFGANPDVCERWRWTASRQLRTCAVCLAMDGKTFPLTTPFGSHVNCRCVPLPVTKSLGEILGDPTIPDRRPQRETGEAWLRKQPADAQRKILGPAKYEAWQAGKIQLDDVVKYHDHPDWGPTRTERSLRDILGEE
jgi:SPP1 gp7 family putative phage head morphogenesis protein